MLEKRGFSMDRDYRVDLAESVIKINDERLKLDFWQVIYLQCNIPFLIAVKSRRIGWSWITALKAIIDANNLDNYQYEKIFISYNLQDAAEKIGFAKTFYHSLPKKIKKKLTSETRTGLEFEDRGGKTRSRLVSLPCRAPRGKGGHLSLDEFSFFPKDQEIYSGSLPVISRGGSLEIGSTPYTKTSVFYDLLNDKRNFSEYKRWELPWWFSNALCENVEQAVKEAPNLITEHRVRKFGTSILNQIFDSMSLAAFCTEYECEFAIDESEAFIPLELIQQNTPLGDDEIIPFRNFNDLIIAYKPEIHGHLHAGYDVGRTKDQAVLTILGVYPGTPIKKIWCSIPYTKIPFNDQETTLCKLMNELPIFRLCIDSTGLGQHLSENLERKYPKKLEGVTFTNPIKELLSNNLYLAFERTECLLPADRDLQSQIHSVKQTVTASKHARFDCEANSQHHADRYWSLCLALHAVGPERRKSDFYKQWQERKRKGSAPAQEKKRRSRAKSQAEVLWRLSQRRFK